MVPDCWLAKSSGEHNKHIKSNKVCVCEVERAEGNLIKTMDYNYKYMQSIVSSRTEKKLNR